MKCFTGTGIFPGFARGTLYIYSERLPEGTPPVIKKESSELGDALKAVAAAQKELDELYAEALEQAGEEAAEIFHVYQGILEDPEYRAILEEEITGNKRSAGEAIRNAGIYFAGMFLSKADEQTRSRYLDIAGLTTRILYHLSARKSRKKAAAGKGIPAGRFILGAYELSASALMKLGKEKLLGIILIGGSEYSHTAILAKSMQIPMAISVKPGYKGNRRSFSDRSVTASEFLTFGGQDCVLSVTGSEALIMVTPSGNNKVL